MSPVAHDLDVHRFLHHALSQLAGVREPDKVLRHVVRAASVHFGASRAYVAVLEPGMEQAKIVYAHPEHAAPDLALLTDLLRGERRSIPEGTVLARLERRGRPWGMIVFDRDAGRFPEGAPRALAIVAQAISTRIEQLDRERLAEVRARIDGKLMRELPPKDLYYQILDGLHQLTRYDHSAALWIWDPERSELELVAEQIRYTKGRSALIGTRVALTTGLATLLGDGAVHGFDWTGSRWQEWTPHGALGIAELIDSTGLEDGRPAEGAMLCAAIGTRQGALGVLKLSERHPGSFAEWERAIVERFTTLASIALERSQTLESLQTRMLKIEQQNALAHLARGVSHDVNNALGEVIPLVQQIRADLASGGIEPALLGQDLERMESSLQVVRRIFGRMLRFARGARSGEPGDVLRALFVTAELMRDGLAKQNVRLVHDASGELPPVRCAPGDLERLFLNLLGNARDAMPDGGRIEVALRREASAIVVSISDDGRGMSPEILREIEHPFFTTKEHGTGLGLSTCRSIVAQAGGALAIESAPERGTRVTLRLMVIGDGDPEVAAPIPLETDTVTSA